MASQPEMHKITKSKNDCPVVQVTIYKDRAQVTRCLQVDLKEGIQELHITDFVEIEEDSIRVEGKGNATIAEVSFQSEYQEEDDVSSEGKDKALQEELTLLRQEMADLQISSKKDVIGKEKELLHDFFSRAARSGIAPDNPENRSLELTGSYINGVKEYITEYRSMNYALMADMQELEKKELDLTKAMAVIEGKLIDLRGGRTPSSYNRECVIVLEAPKETKAELTVSYVVFSASWIPSYDLRMFTDKGNLKLFYYGLISQSTGEDWNDTKIFLSTAEPSFGGTIPRIPITHLSIYQPPVRAAARKSKGFGGSFMRNVRASARSDMDMMSETAMMCENVSHVVFSSPMRTMDVTEAKVVDKTTSTSYEIARNSTIPSDNNPHKVTVAILDFTPELSYVTVPKASPNAFLRAKVVNTSPFMLLAGESSIFLDNSFISKAQLPSAAPKEEFTTSLGVDPSVRVTYKPIIKMKSTSGILAKVEANLYEQVIAVKNLHDYPVKVLVQDSAPKSTTDKIKVQLINPVIDAKHPNKNAGIRLNSYNVLEWDLNIASMATQEIVLKYSIEHPVNVVIEKTPSYAISTEN